MIGLEARTLRSTWVSVVAPPTVAKYLIAYLADTVFPAPDSPETIILWSFCSLKKKKNHNQPLFILCQEVKLILDLATHTQPLQDSQY